MLTNKLLVSFFAAAALVIPHAVRAYDTFGTVDAGYSSTYSEASDWSYDGGSDYSYSSYSEPSSSSYYDHNHSHSSSSHHGGNNEDDGTGLFIFALMILFAGVGHCME